MSGWVVITDEPVYTNLTHQGSWVFLFLSTGIPWSIFVHLPFLIFLFWRGSPQVEDSNLYLLTYGGGSPNLRLITYGRVCLVPLIKWIGPLCRSPDNVQHLVYSCLLQRIKWSLRGEEVEGVGVMKDEELDWILSHTRLSGGRGERRGCQGRGERRGCKWYSDVIHVLIHQSNGRRYKLSGGVVITDTPVYIRDPVSSKYP